MTIGGFVRRARLEGPDKGGPTGDGASEEHQGGWGGAGVHQRPRLYG